MVGVLLINFGFLRLNTNPLATALSSAGDESGAVDPKLIGNTVESALSKARRTGQDLPALINTRGFIDEDEMREWVRSLERSEGQSENERLGRERELWLTGDYAVEPLYAVLADEGMKEFHGAASLAFSLTAYRALNLEVIERMEEGEVRVAQQRNAELRRLRIAHANTLDAGFRITDEDYQKKIDLIHDFWAEHGSAYQFSGAQRWGSIVSETGFVDFFGKLFTGSLFSYEKNRYVFDLIGERWAVTFWLQFLAIALAWSISVPLGIHSARNRGTLEDRVTTNALFLLWSMPEFFVGSLLLYYLCTESGSTLHIFPNRGLSSSDSVWMSTPRYLIDILWHAFLPLLVLSYNSFTALSRYMRGTMLDQFGSDYFRTARAKGCDERRVVYGHALRNSMVTMITLGSSLLAALFGGFVIVEYIFSINGLGLLLLEAARAQDAPLVMGSVIISVLLLLVGILIADILYAVVDPRIRSRYA